MDDRVETLAYVILRLRELMEIGVTGITIDGWRIIIQTMTIGTPHGEW